jgi:hypothetical protein
MTIKLNGKKLEIKSLANPKANGSGFVLAVNPRGIRFTPDMVERNCDWGFTDKFLNHSPIARRTQTR